MYIIIIISISMTTTIIIITIKQAEECDMFNQLMESGYGTAEEVVLYFIFTYQSTLLYSIAIVLYIYLYYCILLSGYGTMRRHAGEVGLDQCMFNVYCILYLLFCIKIVLHCHYTTPCMYWSPLGLSAHITIISEYTHNNQTKIKTSEKTFKKFQTLFERVGRWGGIPVWITES